MRIGYIPPPKPTRFPNSEPLPEHEIQFAVENGIDTLELLSWGWTEEETEWRQQERKLIKNHDIDVSCVGLWGNDYIDPDEREDSFEQFERAVTYAALVNADVFVTGTHYPETMDRETAWDRGIDVFNDQIDVIESHGMTAAFYLGHGNTLLKDDIAHLRRFTDNLPRATLKIDPIGLLARGYDLISVLEEFGDQVGHFHVKDNIILEETEPDISGLKYDTTGACPAGMGDVPWGKVINLLYLGDYEGVLSIEPHGVYWGHDAPTAQRRQGIRLALEHVNQFLKPEDRTLRH